MTLRELSDGYRDSGLTIRQRIRELELAAMMRQVGSPENVEAVTAFLEKRAPRFD